MKLGNGWMLNIAVVASLVALCSLAATAQQTQADADKAPNKQRASKSETSDKAGKPDNSKTKADDKPEKKSSNSGTKPTRKTGGRSGRYLEHGPKLPNVKYPETPEALQQGLEMFHIVNPVLAKRLEQYQKQNPERIETMVRKAWPRLAYLIKLKEENPKGFELRVADMRAYQTTQLLIAQYKTTLKNKGTEAAAPILEKLKAALTKTYDSRVKIRESEVDTLDRRVKYLREQVARMRNDRDKFIDRQLKEVTRASKPKPTKNVGTKASDAKTAQ